MNILDKQKDFKGASEVDQIIKFLQDDTGSVPLTPKLQKHLDQCDFCDNLIRQYGSSSKIIPMLIHKFGITKGAAHRVFQETQLIYRSVGKSTKQYWISVLMDWIADARNRAIVTKDLKSLAQLLRSSVEIMKQMEDDDSESAKITIQYVFQYQPHSLGIQDLTDDELQQLRDEILKPKKKQNIIIEGRTVSNE